MFVSIKEYLSFCVCYYNKLCFNYSPKSELFYFISNYSEKIFRRLLNIYKGKCTCVR